jgi:hypothetical protein
MPEATQPQATSDLTSDLWLAKEPRRHRSGKSADLRRRI